MEFRVSPSKKFEIANPIGAVHKVCHTPGGSEMCDSLWQGEGSSPVMRDVTLQKLKTLKDQTDQTEPWIIEYNLNCRAEQLQAFSNLPFARCRQNANWRLQFLMQLYLLIVRWCLYKIRYSDLYIYSENIFFYCKVTLYNVEYIGEMQGLQVFKWYF